MKAGPNPYQYGVSNPVNAADPTGLQAAGCGGRPSRFRLPTFPRSRDAAQQSIAIAQSLPLPWPPSDSPTDLPRFTHSGSPSNASLHCIWSGKLARQCTRLEALFVPIGHELLHGGGVPLAQDPRDSAYDLHNNAEGLDCADKPDACRIDNEMSEQASIDQDCVGCCMSKLYRGDLQYSPSSYFIAR